eukprot:157486-Prymnesium_polylepis.1
MKPDLDGRTVLGLQPRHKALPETFRDNSSDFDILGPDPLARSGRTRTGAAVPPALLQVESPARAQIGLGETPARA